MKIEWKNRLKNKAVLIALVSGTVAFIYQLLGWMGIAPQISADDIINAAGMLINLLVILGIVVDPNTPGIGDKINEEKQEG